MAAKMTLLHQVHYMYTEATSMRCGHAPGGKIGIALKSETLRVLALRLHSCSRLEADLDQMIEIKVKMWISTRTKAWSA